VRFPKTTSILVTTTVVAVGALIGLPKISQLAAQVEQQDGQLRLLNGAIESLTTQQQWFHHGMDIYQQELDQQAQVLGHQEEVIQNGFERMDESFSAIKGLRSTVEAQAVTTASLQPRVLPSVQRANLRRDVLQPVFQVSGEEAVGSAVLVYHGSDEEGAYYLALSCYHVLRDIVDFEHTDTPHEVMFDTIFDQLGKEPVTIAGRMLAENIDADLALIRINTSRDLGHLAMLAPLQQEALVEAFTPVYTVGCPLGTSAQATRGEVTRNDWVVDGHDYWMVSSPAYFGNSGGGVFLAESHELVGIFSKIYTHGTYRPQVVTHMGLAVPLATIHAWLQNIGYGHILPSVEHPELRMEEASSAP
jgi:hypothetical protein